MELKIKFFDELTTRELYEILRARETIFLLEQRIVCQDMDRVDLDALHCFLWEDGEIKAYLRAYKTAEGTAKMGRVLSVTHGIGLGTRLMNASLPEIKEKLSCDKLVIHAQCHAEGFYRGFGFETTSDVFMEEGVPHVAMERCL